MFRNRVPELADWYHVIAPDRLDLGLSDAPKAAEFSYPSDAAAALTASSLSRSQPAEPALGEPRRMWPTGAQHGREHGAESGAESGSERGPERRQAGLSGRRHGADAVLVGSIEAVEVGDGRLTAAVQLGRSGARVELCVPAALWPSVRRYLCFQVAARGRLCRNPRTGQMLLELRSVDLVEL
jgi:hypothetical protein